MPAGRPTSFKNEYCKLAYNYSLLGATDTELAEFFDVAESTLNLWKKNHSEFSESIKRGKFQADAEIASKLFHRAKGYEHPEDKIFNDQGVPLIVPTIKHYAPDTTAAIFWLKNRQPKKWRDKTEVDMNNNISLSDMDVEF